MEKLFVVGVLLTGAMGFAFVFLACQALTNSVPNAGLLTAAFAAPAMLAGAGAAKLEEWVKRRFFN